MISFSLLDKENLREVADRVFHNAKNENLLDFLSEIDLESGAEYALAESYGCVLVRVCFDGNYAFAFPFDFCGKNGEEGAVSEIEKYAIKEEIPLEICGIPAEKLHIFEKYPLLDLYDEDEDGEYYTARIRSRCSEILEIPQKNGENITLNALTEADIPEFARLSRDEKLLKYWGYDYKDDHADCPDEFFFENQKREFDAGISMTLAIRREDSLIGSLEFYAFDFFDGAEIAVRLFENFQGKGFGKEALKLAKIIAKEVGLKSLYARVINENERSLRYVGGFAESRNSDGQTTIFTLDI